MYTLEKQRRLIINEIKREIQTEKEIYYSEGSTFEQQHKAFKRIQELKEELKGYEL